MTKARYMPSIQIRLEQDLLDRLDYEAERRGVGRNKVVVWALKNGLDALAPLPEDSQR